MANWASEMLFWSAPPADFSLGDHLLTVVAYAGAAGLAVSAIGWSGLHGFRAAFLGGALMGFTVEGVIVGTMYDAFPFQLVWTPLSWHALVSGVLVIGVGRAGARLGPLRLALYWAGLGAVLAFWAQGWPNERADLPGLGPVLAYLAGLGLVVPLAQAVLDRIGTLPRPNRWVALLLPALAALLWFLTFLAAPSPVRLAGPALILLTVWIAGRLGDRGSVPLGPPPGRLWHHGLVLIAPVTMALLAVPGWQAFGGLPSHLILAVLSSCGALGWYLALLVYAIRARRAP